MGHDFECAFDDLVDLFPHCIAEALQGIHYMIKRLSILSIVLVWVFCVAHLLLTIAHAIGGKP